ncbi:hypothetical protein [Sulfitobacter dubius]|uniref:Phage tail tube protein, TTP n=1 Tax=Sulfitobacter dubius TaxID=218673 RepID=A0ABY3ZJ13_9RHOB|nr:hypothetical protein [Sulfitobacter dubius]UOA14523.1 hypothetical protein DSM109990_01329 [Sulfitobacter dubius]
MGLQSSVGIAVGVSATLPSTHDDEAATGFPSLTYTAAGKLNSTAPMTGTKDVATFDNLTTGEEEKLVDILRAGNGDMSFGYDADDAGQALLETAAEASDDATSKVALKFTLNNGDVYYRLAIITSYTPEGSLGNVLMATVGTEFYRKHVKVAAA